MSAICSSSLESESDNGFEIEEHAVHAAVDFLPYNVELEPLATEEEAAEYDAHTLYIVGGIF